MIYPMNALATDQDKHCGSGGVGANIRWVAVACMWVGRQVLLAKGR